MAFMVVLVSHSLEPSCHSWGRQLLERELHFAALLRAEERVAEFMEAQVHAFPSSPCLLRNECITEVAFEVLPASFLCHRWPSAGKCLRKASTRQQALALLRTSLWETLWADWH